MTYKQRLSIENPSALNRDCFGGCEGCPGTYFKGAPHITSCGHNASSATCFDCWTTEIPNSNQLEAKKIATRVKALYDAFRDEGLNDHEAFELTKIIISAEVQHEMSKM